jgi:hypothetical protein
MEADWKEPEDVLPPEGTFVLATIETVNGLRYTELVFMAHGEWYAVNGSHIDRRVLAWTEPRKPWAGTRRGARS